MLGQRCELLLPTAGLAFACRCCSRSLVLARYRLGECHALQLGCYSSNSLPGLDLQVKPSGLPVDFGESQTTSGLIPRRGPSADHESEMSRQSAMDRSVRLARPGLRPL